MRVVIAGAGSVGRSIARELLAHGHEVTLIDRQPSAMRVSQVADATWLLADACELSTLTQARLDECDVVVAATGDDKANLVVSFLAKTEYGVPRTVARVNNPKNEWMFDESWGVDVAVSTPRIMTAMVEEAVAVGDLVRIFTFHQSGADILELTLPADSPLVGRRVGRIPWPADTVLAAVVRGPQPLVPTADDTLEAGDELLFVAAGNVDPAQLQELLVPDEEEDERPEDGPNAVRPDPAPRPALPDDLLPDGPLPDGATGAEPGATSTTA
jgi:trk system potassium uptake protein TrkA